MYSLFFILSFIINQTSKPIETNKLTEILNKNTNKNTLKILFSADIDGNFAKPSCINQKTSYKADFSKLKLLIRSIFVKSEDQNQTKPIVIFGGNIISPAPFGSYLFSDKKRAKWGAKLINSAYPDVISVGINDLVFSKNTFCKYITALSSETANVLASNLSYKDKKCKIKFKKYIIIKRNNKKIGILSLINPSLKQQLPFGIREKVKIEKPIKIYKKIYKTLQKQNVDLMILVVNMDIPTQYPMQTVSFLRKLKQSQYPSVVLSVSSYNPNLTENDYITQIISSKLPTIIGSQRKAKRLSVINIDLSKNKKHAKNPSVSTQFIKPNINILPLFEKRTIENMINAYCKKYGKQAGNAYFSKKYGLMDLLKYLLQTIKISTKSEISFLNKNMLYKENFPLEKKITQAQLMETIILNSPVVVITPKGSDIVAALKQYLSANSDIVVSGLKCKGDKCYVNGNKIQTDKTYRVATTLYLIAGGGGFLPTNKFKPIHKYEGIRDLFLNWLKQGKNAVYDDNNDINLSKDFPDLQYIWVLGSGTNIGLSAGKAGVLKRNTTYQDVSSLAKDNVYQINTDITGYITYGNVNHSFAADGRILYGKTWTVLDSGDKNSSETADEIKINLLYQWKKIKYKHFKQKWWAPFPFTEFSEQTEFTPDVVTTNNDKKRYKMQLGIAGVGIEPWESRFFIKLGAGLKRETAAEGINNLETFYFGWNLLNGNLFKAGNIVVKAESRLDSYIQRKINENVFSYEVKVTTKIYFVLTEKLFFNITGESYSYKLSTNPWSTAFNLLFGINYSTNTRIPFL